MDKEIIVIIDASGKQDSGKTRAINAMLRGMKNQFEIVNKEYLNESEHQIRITAKMKKGN